MTRDGYALTLMNLVVTASRAVPEFGYPAPYRAIETVLTDQFTCQSQATAHPAPRYTSRVSTPKPRIFA